MTNLRWWYLPLTLLVITAFVPMTKEVSRGNRLDKQATLAIAPTYTVEKIREEFSWIKTVEQDWNGPAGKDKVPSDPSIYWDYLDRRAMLVDAVAKFLSVNHFYEQPGVEVEARQKLLSGSPVAIIQMNFQTKFGQNKMMEIKPKNLYGDRQRPSVKTNAGAEFMAGYILCIPVMFLINIVRLKVRDLLVAPELLRLTMYSIIWPIGLLMYPKDIRREEQLKQWAYITAQVASVAMGFFGFMPLLPIAKAQTNDGKDKTGKSQKKSPEKRFSIGGFHSGVEYYPGFLTGGPDKGNLLSPWYSVKEKVGPIQFSHFGFIEAGNRKSQLFSNHGTSANWDKAPWLEYRMETGFTSTNGFLTSGPRVFFSKIPGLGKLLNKSGVSSLGSADILVSEAPVSSPRMSGRGG